MLLVSQTRRNLELTETMRDKNKKGSLLNVLDKTGTAMGARMLRSFVEQPLLEKSEIEKWLDAVEERTGLDKLFRLQALVDGFGECLFQPFLFRFAILE